ncbi:MAG: AAA family ATPase [Parcubacteria group bacterium]|nr:AAA family ATPase [Parcubacteria group bacterium]
MDISNVSGYTLKNINKINIVLGKNGSGKSTMLRLVEQGLSSQTGTYDKTKYITPERGGALIYEAGVEQSLTNDINWLSGQRRRNQATGFRQQSVAQYRKLETLVLREIEKEKRQQNDYTFDIYVNKINSLLDNIEIKRHETTFEIYRKGTTNKLDANAISSGESELISLGIECLIFGKECLADKGNILFLDEPDVHLHPDLQVRLMHFLKGLVAENNFQVVIATHSTAILGALESYADTHLAFMVYDQKELDFKVISEVYKKVLPVFGAHPLSNFFNEAPILLVEGEDDERIWQQAVRSAGGKIKIYPCSVDSVSNINDFEQETQKIVQTVYDNAKGYSLRDRDDGEETIDDLLPIVRMKLSCRNAENLLLSDDVLEALSVTWDELKQRIETWLKANSQHAHFFVMNGFKEDGYNRKNYDIKEVRNDLMGIIGSAKPWEVVVGQKIANLIWADATSFEEEGKMLSYLGRKVAENLIPKST